MRWFLSAIGVVVLSAAIAAANNYLTSSPSRRHPFDAAAERLRYEIDQQYRPVSLISLLARPELYDDQKVRSEGFVTVAFEDCAIHLDEAAYKAGLRMNAIWVAAPRWCASETTRHLNRHYGEVAGTFRASESGHMGAYSGSFTQVRRIKRGYTDSDFQAARGRERDEVLRMQFLSVWFLTITGWTALAVLWLIKRRSPAR